MRVVVFGAGGFVGGWICEELASRGDVEVVGCVRKWASSVRIARRGIDLRQVDLEDVDQINNALMGVDAVINASMPNPLREPELVKALYLASAKTGVTRFVQFSSAAVYGNQTGTVDETAAPSPIDPYSHGKAEMERRLLEAANPELPLFILRPSIIYGPFSDAWTVRYVDRITKGKWLDLGSLGDGTCNLVHAHDVATAAITAATRDTAASTHVLNINGPDILTWNEYISGLGDALGVAARTRPSTLAFRSVAAAAEVMRMGAKIGAVKSFYRRSVGATKSVMKGAQDVTKLYPSAGELQLLARKVHYPADKAATILGFRASVGLNEGLRQSVAWCRVHGVA